MRQPLSNYITSKPEIIIFDVDGTLYDQKKLRKLVAMKLMKQLLTFQTGFRELQIISCFRKEREKHRYVKTHNIGKEQYNWCCGKLGIAAEKIQYVVKKNMYDLPIPFLKRVKFRNVDDLFGTLKHKGIRVIAYSDYPAREKMETMGLHFDACYCSADEELDEFKPSRKVLLWICNNFRCETSKALYIGDRDEVDGAGARSAGIPYININFDKARKGLFFKKLTEEIKTL